MAGPLPLPYHPRPESLQRLRRAVQQYPHVVLSAPRGHGKSALIQNELAPSLLDEGWKVSVVTVHSPVLPPLLTDLRLVACDGDPQTMAALRDHGGAPAHQQVAQALAWLAESSHDPHLLVLENAHRLAEPGNNRLVTAMHHALHSSDRQLRVLFTVSSRVAMEELFSRRGAPFQNDAWSIALDFMQEDFLIARSLQLAEHGLDIHSVDLGQSLLRQSYNLQAFEQVLQTLISGQAGTLEEAERLCKKPRPALI